MTWYLITGTNQTFEHETRYFDFDNRLKFGDMKQSKERGVRNRSILMNPYHVPTSFSH